MRGMYKPSGVYFLLISAFSWSFKRIITKDFDFSTTFGSLNTLE